MVWSRASQFLVAAIDSLPGGVAQGGVWPAGLQTIEQIDFTML